jgi:hypothetical protein
MRTERHAFLIMRSFYALRVNNAKHIIKSHYFEHKDNVANHPLLRNSLLYSQCLPQIQSLPTEGFFSIVSPADRNTEAPG